MTLAVSNFVFLGIGGAKRVFSPTLLLPNTSFPHSNSVNTSVKNPTANDAENICFFYSQAGLSTVWQWLCLTEPDLKPMAWALRGLLLNCQLVWRWWLSQIWWYRWCDKMPRKLSEQDLGFTKHSRGSHFYNVSETLAKEACELEAHSGKKKRCQFGESSTPTYYMCTTSPAPCFSRSYPSQPVLSWARTSKEEWSPTIPVFVCMLLPLKPTLEGPTWTEGDCGGKEQTLDLPHKSSYLASGIVRGTLSKTPIL